MANLTTRSRLVKDKRRNKREGNGDKIGTTGRKEKRMGFGWEVGAVRLGKRPQSTTVTREGDIMATGTNHNVSVDLWSIISARWLGIPPLDHYSQQWFGFTLCSKLIEIKMPLSYYAARRTSAPGRNCSITKGCMFIEHMVYFDHL